MTNTVTKDKNGAFPRLLSSLVRLPTGLATSVREEDDRIRSRLAISLNEGLRSLAPSRGGNGGGQSLMLKKVVANTSQELSAIGDCGPAAKFCIEVFDGDCGL